MDDLHIREAKITDKQALALLCCQLGYQTEDENIPTRLKRIKKLKHHVVYVAELGKQLVGWVHVYLCPLLISGQQAQLGGMIVKENFRNKGVGKELLHQAENWARSKDCQTMIVFSNVIRLETHQFYAQMGYKTVKTELVLEKEL